MRGYPIRLYPRRTYPTARIPYAPLKRTQNVPQSRPSSSQTGPKVSLLETLGGLLTPASTQVAKACPKACRKAVTACQEGASKPRNVH